MCLRRERNGVNVVIVLWDDSLPRDGWDVDLGCGFGMWIWDGYEI